jgi:hypothetical protein
MSLTKREKTDVDTGIAVSIKKSDPSHRLLDSQGASSLILFDGPVSIPQKVKNWLLLHIMQ